MQEIISKELLSAVLNIKGNFRYGFDDISIPELDKVEFNSQTNMVFMSLKPSMLYGTVAPVIRTNSINVYELAHKCKEWAYKNGFILRSEYYPPDSFLFSGGCLLINISAEESEWFNGTIEPEAIFEACQWILNNKAGSQ